MARRAAGTRKRPDGSLEKRFTVEGKRYSVYGATVKEVTAKEHEIREQIKNGTYTANSSLTLDKYFKEWAGLKRSDVKPNSLRVYSSHYKNHISPVLGKRRIQAIERREIIRLQNKLRETLSVTSCNGVLRAIKAIFNGAVKDGVISRSPAEGVKFLKTAGPKANETYHRALTEQEQEAFMEELKGDYYYYFLAFLLCTGMRYGEAAALTWADVDRRNNVIHVTKTVTVTEDNRVTIGETPKTDSGKRDIPITATIDRLLQEYRQTPGAQLDGQVMAINQRIFSSVHGEIITNCTVNRAIRMTLNRLEKKGAYIDHFTAHALRDTFATRFIEQGGNPQTLKTILGHSSLAMTMDLYSHVLPNTRQKEMDSLTIVI